MVTGQEADAARMTERLDAMEATLGCTPGTVTADLGIGRVCEILEDRGIRARDSTTPQYPAGQGLPDRALSL